MVADRDVNARKIEINSETADLLEARAAALGISVAELMAAIVGNKPVVTPQAANGDAQAAGDTPAAKGDRFDARWGEVKAWIDSWGKTNELPRPKLGK
jgi:predicted transcriptional regulator